MDNILESKLLENIDCDQLKRKAKKNRFRMINYYIEGSYFQFTQHIATTLKYKRTKYGAKKILTIEDGRKQLIEAVNNGKPYMAARFGTSECGALVRYWEKEFGFCKKYRKLDHTFLCNNAGFFPDDEKMFDIWAQMETDCCSDVDMLGVMNTKCEGWIAETFLPEKAMLMPQGGLGSGPRGWCWCLEGKKILVIHPMVDTIKRQYKKREFLFQRFEGQPYPLPEFELDTIRAVQTIADETDERFSNWFEALDYMTDEVAKKRFRYSINRLWRIWISTRIKNKENGKNSYSYGWACSELFRNKKQTF